MHQDHQSGCIIVAKKSDYGGKRKEISSLFFNMYSFNLVFLVRIFFFCHAYARLPSMMFSDEFN